MYSHRHKQINTTTKEWQIKEFLYGNDIRLYGVTNDTFSMKIMFIYINIMNERTSEQTNLPGKTE